MFSESISRLFRNSSDFRNFSVLFPDIKRGKLEVKNYGDYNKLNFFEETIIDVTFSSKNRKSLERCFKNCKKHGKTTRWDFNGTKGSEMEYKDGKMDGTYRSWYTGGEINSVQYYKNDMMEGPFTIWHEDGNEFMKGQYAQGLEDGIRTTVVAGKTTETLCRNGKILFEITSK